MPISVGILGAMARLTAVLQVTWNRSCERFRSVIYLALTDGPPFAFTAPDGTTLDTAGQPAVTAVTGPVPAITTALTLNGSSYVGLTGLPRPGPCVVRRTASGRRSPATSRSSFGSA